MTTSNKKETYVQIRIRDDIKEDLRIAAEARGLTVSALLHSLIVKTIREEREVSPDAFSSASRSKIPGKSLKIADKSKFKRS